ncbi:MAG: aminoacyl-histidine dipeptidase [Acidobacteriota bacterium]
MFDNLQPALVWQHFATLCRIPRPSKQEAALRDHILQWAQGLNLSTQVDTAGNLIIRKPASPGHEHAPGVVLQAHLDMVCQKNAGSTHDFTRDPIQAVVRDGWVQAEHTTLGADNGMGVAMILAVLQDTQLQHGPIEALLTVDEEAGMGGAHGLQPGLLQGRLMLNLDTEEWGEFYLGCAGGVDVNVERPGQPVPWPAGHRAARVTLNGLRGGHSGVNIHEGRGNAIKLLVRVLNDLQRRFDIRLASLQGGTARNALPREAFATVAVAPAHWANLQAALVTWQTLLHSEWADVEPHLQLQIAEGTPTSQVLSPQEQAVWLHSLHAAPHGVKRMSARVTGVVETSDNLGMVELHAQQGACNFMVRSLISSASSDLADEIISLFALSGTVATASGHYPGWAPNPGSPLLARCQAVYRSEHGHDARVQVIHAGLECGLIAARYPDMDIVSFGPTIRGAHAPGESVEIESVAKTWHLLTAILAAILR